MSRGKRRTRAAGSWFVWNEVVFNSLQSGYVKKLDWNLYCDLKSPVAKRLYRFLDKRFWHEDQLSFDVHELAFDKVRLTRHYKTVGEVKRELLKGIEELESKWDLRRMSVEKRFQKVARGKWEVAFSKRESRRVKAVEPGNATGELEAELVKRKVGPATARDLVEGFPQKWVREMIALVDWYNQQAKREVRGAGFSRQGDSRAELRGAARGVSSFFQTIGSTDEKQGSAKRTAETRSPSV